MNDPIEKIVQWSIAVKDRILGSGWRAELLKCAFILTIAYLAMFKGDFGFTETPYNFF